jgi:copper chaperone CopZ
MPVTTRYEVTGMTCDHCVAAVTGELAQLPGVQEVSVDLPTGEVLVSSDQPLPIDQVRAAVDEAGYALAADG